MPGRIAFLVAIGGWVFTLLGWWITHAFTLRAQRQAFLNNVVDAARKDVVAATRVEQMWAIEMTTSLMALDALLAAEERGQTVNWFEEAQRLRKVIYTNRRSLLMVLEEYENVFPQTYTCRADFGKRIRHFTEAADEIARALFSPAPARLNAVKRAREVALETGMDLQALLEDLRVHIQNQALAKITGWKVQHRRVRDEACPRLLADADGNLRIQV